MDLALALTGMAVSAALWLGGALTAEWARVRTVAQLPAGLRELMRREAPHALAGRQRLNSPYWDWRGIILWMLPIAVVVGLLALADFPTVVLLATPAAYALLSTADEYNAGRAEGDRLWERLDKPSPSARRLPRLPWLPYLLALSVCKLGFFLLPATAGLAVAAAL